MKRFGKLAIWILLNGAMAWFAWRWVVDSASIERNLFLFIFWINFFLLVITAIAVTGDETFAAQVGERSVPNWVSVIYDIALSLFLAANGHFFLATFNLAEPLLSHAIYDKAKGKEASA